MSRRKQAKPRSLKPELDSRTSSEVISLYENAILDVQDAAEVAPITIATATETYDTNGDINPILPAEFPISQDDSLESDALGTDQGSSWHSETPDEAQTSPAPSSCATPNSTTDLPDSELSYTVGITEATPYACQFCDKAFPRQSFLKKHEQTHSDHMPFRCEFCSRLFKHKRSRDRHIKLHTGDKKYRCTQCEAAFSRSDHLKIHMKTHDTQKPFQCTVCNRGYNTAAALTSHMQNHKRQRPETPLASTGPGSNSNSGRNTENISEESVSSPNVFRCMQCGESFKKQENLQSHILSVHASDLLSPIGSLQVSVSAMANSDPRLPPFTTKLACIYCTKDSFTTMEQLQLHVQAMHSAILNGDIRDYPVLQQQNQNQATATSTSSPHDLMTPPPMNSTNSSNSLYSCEMCTMRFPSLHRLQKHSVTVHRNCNLTSQKELLESAVQQIQKDLFDSVAQQNNAHVCVQCALSFPTSADFSEHVFSTHGIASPNLIPMSPVPEQLKPTDLSRKIPRSGSVDRKSKRLCVHDDGANKTEQITANTSSAQYDYSGMLICNQCAAALPDFESFRTHLKSHLEQACSSRQFLQSGRTSLLDTFQQEMTTCLCPHCGGAFKDLSTCEQHIYTHFLSTTTEYTCQSCVKMFSKPDEMQKHLMDIHAHHLYRCSLCKDMFDSKVAIQVHFAVKHSNEYKLYRCTACSNITSIFHTELEFGIHVRTVHGALTLLQTLQASPKPFRCTFCRQSFGSELEMQFHLATHTKQFRCPICPESFQIEYLLDRHIEAYHSNVVNADNNSAEMDKFNKKSLSNSPIQTGKSHNSPGRNSQKSSTGDNNNINKKQYDVSDLNNCDICERTDFSNETELVAHRKLVHHTRNNTKNGVLSLHCAYCNENCKTRTELENHMKIHSQSSGVTGKHKCNICDEICASAVLLAEHKLTHCKVISGNCCTQCKASLTNEDQFYSHLMQHSNNNNSSNQKTKSQVILPTPCVICRQTLISDIEVRIHSQFHLRNTMQKAEFICTSCFKTVDALNVIATNGKYICSECFALHPSTTAQQQQQQQQQQRSYHCNDCQVTFESNTTLEQHIDSAHSKTYTCIKCQASFEKECDVQVHVTTHLIMEGSNHECHLCRRLFLTPMKLQAHLIEHTFAGCGAFTCYLCSAVFTGSKGLQNHILEHGLTARPYDCPQCNLKFFFRAELDNHSYSHLEIASKSSGDTDIPLISPKMYCTTINTKHGIVNNGDVLKYYVQEIQKKKKIQSPIIFKCSTCIKEFVNETDFQSHKQNCQQSENVTVKEEVVEDTEQKKDEYIEVSSPAASSSNQNETINSVDNNEIYKEYNSFVPKSEENQL